MKRVFACRAGPRDITVAPMTAKEVERITGVATLLHAVQVPQPGWIRDLMSMDDVL